MHVVFDHTPDDYFKAQALCTKKIKPKLKYKLGMLQFVTVLGLVGYVTLCFTYAKQQEGYNSKISMALLLLGFLGGIVYMSVFIFFHLRIYRTFMARHALGLQGNRTCELSASELIIRSANTELRYQLSAFKSCSVERGYLLFYLDSISVCYIPLRAFSNQEEQDRWVAHVTSCISDTNHSK